MHAPVHRDGLLQIAVRADRGRARRFSAADDAQLDAVRALTVDSNRSPDGDVHRAGRSGSEVIAKDAVGFRPRRGDAMLASRFDGDVAVASVQAVDAPRRVACRREAAASGVDVDVADALVHTPDAMGVCVILTGNKRRAFRVDYGIDDVNLDIAGFFVPAHDAFRIRVCCFEREIFGINGDIAESRFRVYS